MTTVFQHNDIFKHAFMREVRNAFSHIDAVENAFNTCNLEFFLGTSMEALIDENMSFEEYFCRNLLKKCVNISVGDHDPLVFAHDKFVNFMHAQEHKGLRVKALLETLDTSTDVGRALCGARDLLHKMFKDFQEYNVVPRYTGGATITLSKKDGASPFKRFNASEGADVLAQIAERRFSEGVTRYSFTDMSMPLKHGDATWHVVAGFVPKTWKEHRLIGFPPSAPLALQCGVGDWMTERLHRVGIHINTAQETHKRVARMASLLTSHLMTLDQSNASDNILRWLVKWLVPQNLYDYLLDITPSTIKMESGETFQSVHMMATAGNGYIFPLQTAIFWALATATCNIVGVKSEVYSYGDDLIAPCSIYNQLVKVFSSVGLQVNTEKTFLRRGIRESCGGDYVQGTDVRPLYVKELPTTTLGWIRCINGIRRVGFDNNVNCWRSNAFRRLWLWCVSRITIKDRLFAPIHYGDVAIGTCNDKLYKLSYKKSYTIDGKRHNYPTGGLHPSGHPYSGWYIETYSTKSSGKRRTFGQETQGIDSASIMRLVPLSSVKGSGLRTIKVWVDDKNVKLSKPIYKLGYKPFYGGDELTVERQFSPLFLSPPAPRDNIDDLFDHLSDDCIVKDVDAVVHRGKIRYDNAIASLLTVLSRRVSSLESYEFEARRVDLSF